MTVLLRRLGALIAALALATLGVLALAASASAGPAADPPAPGTAACTTLVKLDPLVVAAQTAVNAAPANTTDDELAALKATLDAQVKAAIGRLCTGDPTPTTTAPPTSTTTPSPNGDVKDCTDFASRAAAQAYYDSVTTPGNPDPSKLDRDGDGKACEPNEGGSPSGGGSGSGGIDPTRDDGSVTSGGQVVDVPEGSASTGA